MGKVTSVHTALLWGEVGVCHPTGEAGSSSLAFLTGFPTWEGSPVCMVALTQRVKVGVVVRMVLLKNRIPLGQF